MCDEIGVEIQRIKSYTRDLGGIHVCRARTGDSLQLGLMSIYLDRAGRTNLPRLTKTLLSQRSEASSAPMIDASIMFLWSLIFDQEIMSADPRMGEIDARKCFDRLPIS